MQCNALNTLYLTRCFGKLSAEKPRSAKMDKVICDFTLLGFGENYKNMNTNWILFKTILTHTRAILSNKTGTCNLTVPLLHYQPICEYAN